MTANMKVLLLKEPRESGSEADPYVKELASCGHTAALVPVLSFTFVSLKELLERLFEPERFGGLIFTSPRAVEAVRTCLDSNTHTHKWDAVKDKWNQKAVYVVGKATASLVEDLGLHPLGEETGTADALSLLILQRESEESRPLLFPCGSIKREVLPTALRRNRVPLETLTVYQTSEHPDLQKNITDYFTQQGVPACVAFFSPSGVSFCLELMKRLSGTRLEQIQFAAIGPTTAEALRSHGLTVRCCAEKPTAKHLTAAITQRPLTSDLYRCESRGFMHSCVCVCVCVFRTEARAREVVSEPRPLPLRVSIKACRAASSQSLVSVWTRTRARAALTMLVPIRLIFILQIFTFIRAEKIFHSRDHSDAMNNIHQAELITDTDTAQRFLSRYGFIKAGDDPEISAEASGEMEVGLSLDLQEGGSTSRSSSDDLQFTAALKDFQKVSGLPVTGVFDDATKAAMNKPRCGVPDQDEEPNSTSTHSGEKMHNLTDAANASAAQTSGETRAHVRKKRQLALLLKSRARSAETGHMAFSKSLLKWRLIGEGYSSQLSIDEQKFIFRLAFRMWSEVSPLQFVEDAHSPLEDIDIRLGFGTGRHLGCSQRFDGAGREFAHAWFLGDIHFDDDEHFTVPNTGSGISLLKVAVHEIGHVLGLPHIYRPGSIMQPSYLPQDGGFEIDWMDRKSIQSLYGVCKGRFSTAFDWIRKEQTAYGEVVVRFNTYFMRDGWYWLYENRNNRTRFGDPVAVRLGWHGLPSGGVDAYVHVWNRKTDAVYFFKGVQYWRYDPENDQVFAEDSDGHSYPRLISEGFPGVSGPVDTAYYDRRDAHIYFFKGSRVFRFDVRMNRLASSSPQNLSAVFPAVIPGNHPVGHLDVAYFSYTHNAVFLLKGSRFWRVASGRDRRRGAPPNGLLPGREVHEQWFDICDVHTSSLRTARR
ncbi:matrix metallopeptidase-21-like [Pseudorasbora parva]|uniref:matrix metallopeptidase-21-like n=1 Tax=Pseudorasbora parva TaxID=51549 RepID=UPI00351DD417